MYNFFKSIFWNELGSIRFYSFCNSPLSQTEPCDSKWQAQFYCCLKSILIAEAGIILRALHNSTLLRTKHSIRSSMPGSLSLYLSLKKMGFLGWGFSTTPAWQAQGLQYLIPILHSIFIINPGCSQAQILSCRSLRNPAFFLTVLLLVLGTMMQNSCSWTLPTENSHTPQTSLTVLCRLQAICPYCLLDLLGAELSSAVASSSGWSTSTISASVCPKLLLYESYFRNSSLSLSGHIHLCIQV